MAHVGLLILRLVFGGTMLLAHGLPKLQNYSEYSVRFGDPIGLGPEVSLILAIFAELVCAALVVLGLFSRMALIPLIITMAVALLIVHAADPFQKQELAFLYLSAFVTLFLTGPGRFSVQEFFRISSGRFGWLLS